MDIGIPQIDFLGVFTWLFNFAKTYGTAFFYWVLDACGGNPFIAGIVIGTPIYIVMDYFYHSVLDKPAASVGNRVSHFGVNIIIFIIIFIMVWFARK